MEVLGIAGRPQLKRDDELDVHAAVRTLGRPWDCRRRESTFRWGLIRAPNDHINIGILQTMLSGPHFFKAVEPECKVFLVFTWSYWAPTHMRQGVYLEFGTCNCGFFGAMI